MRIGKSIGSKILISYIVIGVILTVLAGFIIYTNLATNHNLETIDSYITFYEYPVKISVAFADARVNNRIMMTSIFYDNNIYNDGISLIDDVVKTFSDFKSKTAKYDELKNLSALINETSEQIDAYKQLMVDNHTNNKTKLDTQNLWSAKGGDCLRVIAGMNEYINTYWSSLSDAPTEVYRTVLENKLALEAARSLITTVRLNSLDMMYMDEINNYEAILDELDKMDELFDSYKAYAYPDILPMIDTLKEYFVEYRILTTEYYQLVIKTSENVTKFNNINVELQELFNSINSETTSSIQEVVLNATIQQKATLFILIILNILLIVIICLYALFLIRSITSSLKNAAESLRTATDKINSYTNKITDVATRLSESGSEQSASIEETSATMTQTASMAKRNSESTRQAAELASATLKSAFDGVNAMDNLVNFMNKLSKSSNEINKIVDSINTIAFQTNILALNASVEAVRAGEAGKSFTVVAEEVRTLSQKSAQAANNTVGIVNENISLSGQSVQNSADVSTMLKAISADMQKVTGLINDISAASDEQARGIQQIDIALTQIEKATYSNASVADESAATANDLKIQTDNLIKVYRNIEKLVYGNE